MLECCTSCIWISILYIILILIYKNDKTPRSHLPSLFWVRNKDLLTSSGSEPRAGFYCWLTWVMYHTSSLPSWLLLWYFYIIYSLFCSLVLIGLQVYRAVHWITTRSPYSHPRHSRFCCRTPNQYLSTAHYHIILATPHNRVHLQNRCCFW